MVKRVWDSKGTHPDKTGKNYRADPEIRNDQGPLTCGGCNGTGTVVRAVHDATVGAEDGAQDHNEKTCGTCKGNGKVKR